MKEDKIRMFLKKAKEVPGFNKIKFVFLYGSYAENKQNKFSDVDFAVYYSGAAKERFRFRLKLLSKLPENFDVQIFQDLPLYVRKDVLKGKLIYAKDLTFAYDTAYQTIKDFDHFKKYYYDYIGYEEAEAA